MRFKYLVIILKFYCACESPGFLKKYMFLNSRKLKAVGVTRDPESCILISTLTERKQMVCKSLFDTDWVT